MLHFSNPTDISGRPSPEPDKRSEAVKELRAIDCKTPEDWARWARQRVEDEDGYGYERGRRY